LVTDDDVKHDVGGADKERVSVNGGGDTPRRREDALADCDRLLSDAARVMRDARAVSERVHADTLAEVEAQAAALLAEAERARAAIVDEARRIRDEVLASTDEEAEQKLAEAEARAAEVRAGAIEAAAYAARLEADRLEAEAATARAAREQAFKGELEQKQAAVLEVSVSQAERLLADAAATADDHRAQAANEVARMVNEARAEADDVRAAAVASGQEEVARLLAETLALGRAEVDRLLADAANERARLLEEAKREVRELVQQAEHDALLVRAEATQWFANRAREAAPAVAPAVAFGEDLPATVVPPAAAETAPKAEPTRRRRTVIGEVLLLVVVPVLAALMLKTYVAQAFYIPSESMEPKLEKGDRVIVSKVSYRLDTPSRGDVVVFHPPIPQPEDTSSLPARVFHEAFEAIGLRHPGDDTFIKRVIGLPDEIVEGRDGRVFVDGQPLEEPYLESGVATADFKAVHVGSDELFVMGDNRPNSSDSRSFGSIPRSSVVGEATTLAWPPLRAGFL
jgi:signal peptidase I